MPYQPKHDLEKNYEGWLRWTSVIFVLVIIIFQFTREKPPTPTNDAAYGCYLNPYAPPILLEPSGMSIVQIDFPRIGFHLERHKSGIALTAEAPIHAKPIRGGYEYGIDQRGIGLFLPFYRIENGKSYGVFEADQLRSFTMLARDDHYLKYVRSDSEDCRLGREVETAQILPAKR